MPQLVVSTEHN